MTEDTVLCEVKASVAELTLNRPERLNAFTPQMGAELIGAFKRLDEDDSVLAIIVTGAGRAFCAGADLGGGQETFAGRESDDAEDVLARFGVEVTRRFVGEDDEGIADEGPGDGDALLLAAGKLGGTVEKAVGQPHALRQDRRSSASLGLRNVLVI